MFKIFIISIFMYIYLTVLLRLFGKKEFSQLNVFDFVVFLVISEITTMSLETQDLSVLDSVIATLTLIILDRIESFITMRSKKLRDFFEGRPCYIIYRGKIQYQNMKKLRYSIDDLCHHLRVSDIDSVSKVDFAILETNGSLSVIPKQESQTLLPDALISDGCINQEALQILNKDEAWLKNELKKKHISHIEDVLYCVLEKKGLYVIKKLISNIIMIINPTIKLIVPTSTSFKAFASGISSSIQTNIIAPAAKLKAKGRMLLKS